MNYSEEGVKIISPALERGVIKGTLNNNFTPVSKIKLEDLGNVAIVDPKEGEVLKYNGTTGKWENKNDIVGEGVDMPDEDFVTDEGVVDQVWNIGIYDGGEDGTSNDVFNPE